MSRAFVEYKDLLRRLRLLRKEWEDDPPDHLEDRILDKMDEVWWKLKPRERKEAG